MADRNHIGSVLEFAAALPATNDEAGFEALTWQRVPDYQGGLRLGFEHSDIDIGDITEGVTEVVKGSGKGNQSTLSFFRGRAAADVTAQNALRAVANSAEGLVSIRTGKPTGADGAWATGDEQEYAQGIVKNDMAMEQSDSSYAGFEVTFAQNARAVTGTSS